MLTVPVLEAGAGAAATSEPQAAEAAAGGSPRVLTGGEEKRTAKLDWLNVTWALSGRADLFSRKYMADTFLVLLRQWLRGAISYEYGEGLHGFSNSVRFYGLSGGNVQLLSIVAWGGASQNNRGYLELTGTACQVVKNWAMVRRDIERLADVKITRVDLAVDFLNGEYTPMEARDHYGEGLFQFSRRMAPKCSEVGDWTYHRGEGRTFYVGRRENGKQARIYEKGKQLGCPFDPWVRFEVELHNRDRVIPLDVLTEPDRFFAGCFPICERLVKVEGTRITTFQEEFCITLDALIGYAKLSYGKLFNVLRKAGYPVEEIFRLLRSDGVPARLAKSDWQSSTGEPDVPIPSEVCNAI